MRAFSIVPPGEEGDVTALELATGDFGEHYDDQVDAYAALIDDDNVIDLELPTYFHSMQFGPEGAVTDEYSPTEGVTVFRDEMGIPHIYADNTQTASFALGYVTAEDRLWESDIFRHAARGTLSEFVGPGDDDAFVEMDIETRREGYTEEEIQRAFNQFDDRFGATGQQIQTGLTAFADGFNEYVATLTQNPEACPSEYAATGNPCPGPFPQEWTPLDTLFLAVLQLRVFGETAGQEIQNAGLYAHLEKRLGRRLGRKVFNDLLWRNDPTSPTSISRNEGRFRAQRLGDVKRASFAIPDGAVKLAQETAVTAAARQEALSRFGFTGLASNALLVSASESASGNPLQIGAPQVGYANPSFFFDVDVHAPGVDFRGPAVPGASALIPLGRGTDYAWSLTTGVSDAVDVRVELLCKPGGGKPTKDSEHYLFRGTCRKMESRDETFVVKPSPASPGEPRIEERTFYRTRHGPVFARGTVGEKPVAFVKERFFWMKELDSIPRFYEWNTQVDSLDDFRAAAKDFTMSFNAFYADAENIAYFHVGHYPVRKEGVHPSLPIWGTGRWEWQGRFPWRRHPKVVNPEQGWVANWNNKPALGWDSFDGIKWGSVQRVQLLKDRMHELFDGAGQGELSDIVDVIRDAATRDTRGVYLGPKMLRWAGRTTGAEDRYYEALDVVRGWVQDGAHRVNQDRDDNMDNGAALAIFDAWYDALVHGVFDDELGEAGFELLAPMGAPVTDYTPESGSSFWNDFSSYLRNLFRTRTRGGFARNYCDVRTTGARESCRSQVVDALEKALADLTEEQGEDMGAWTVPAENIEFFNLGAGSVDPIPWQNRGTHNHVVEIIEDASP
jgi:acyl-homoserine lactone acylase PvdQ